MAHLIPLSTVERYSAAPSASTVAAVRSLQENLRGALGTSYETFLQGSYKNDTSIPDLDDVDIIAIRKGTYSTHFTGRSSTAPISWETIFNEVQQRLEANHSYQGKTAKRDKCVNVATGFSADVVPAVEITDTATDPISIFSRSAGTERKNSPRIHYNNAVAKHQATQERFKPTVRMFKRWCRSAISDEDIAPSFYVECLVYNFTDASFIPDAAQRFRNIGEAVVGLAYGSTYITSVAGDKDILVEAEWSQARFRSFQEMLAASLVWVNRALTATAQDAARSAWQTRLP